VHEILRIPKKLKDPRTQLFEHTKLKKSIDQFQTLKEKVISIKKKERMIKNGWRHGVLGVDGPELG
jgi:hypothetical protein